MLETVCAVYLCSYILCKSRKPLMIRLHRTCMHKKTKKAKNLKIRQSSCPFFFLRVPFGALRKPVWKWVLSGAIQVGNYGPLCRVKLWACILQNRQPSSAKVEIPQQSDVNNQSWSVMFTRSRVTILPNLLSDWFVLWIFLYISKKSALHFTDGSARVQDLNWWQAQRAS